MGSFFITWEVIGIDKVNEEGFLWDEKIKADHRYEELSKTPNIQNLTMYQTIKFMSVTD